MRDTETAPMSGQEMRDFTAGYTTLFDAPGAVVDIHADTELRTGKKRALCFAVCDETFLPDGSLDSFVRDDSLPPAGSLLYLDGPAHAGIASINVDIAGDPLAQPSVPLKENHLVHDVVVRQVHPKLLQHRMVQQGAGGRKGVVPYTGIQAAVREKDLIADGEAA